jgi:hypothetical protein
LGPMSIINFEEIHTKKQLERFWNNWNLTFDPKVMRNKMGQAQLLLP